MRDGVQPMRRVDDSVDNPPPQAPNHSNSTPASAFQAGGGMTPADLHDLVSAQIEECCNLRSVLNVALSWCLKVNGTARGNIQLMDWRFGYLTIAAHRGFDEEFVGRFARVRARDGTACGRAIRDRRAIVIEDVLTDREFAPYRATAAEFGFRAVQSTPLISRSGALVGVMSVHFPVRHRGTNSETEATQLLAQLAANAIIRQRAERPGGERGPQAKRIAESLAAVRSSWEALRRTDERRAPEPSG